ncbi:MAG: PSD1 domain-containing protein [Armatimonadetes bacterium]|nr:PSD1 domain-containing protein [Armatimonadota bacterium]
MKQARSLILFVSAAGCLGYGLAANPAQDKGKPTKTIKAVDFNRDIRPILSEHCFRCHGPDGKEVKANLRLSDEKDATRERDGEWVIKSGSAKDSLIMTRIAVGGDDPMPPKDSGVEPLTKEQVETIRRWIDQGAKYEKHWAFVPPVMPEIPKVKAKSQVRNPIDNFILAKLEPKGLKLENEADPATLLRRASLSLTGLLPTPEEIQQLESDKKPGAYDRAVDRLLASPRYGENQARYWLDAVRYGDTHGLHLDNERMVYPYRDWVVNAFNEDMPYDKFTLWQLAGDLMPNPTRDMLVATGYVRMNPTTDEGGAIEEEFLVKNTMDRVDTMSTVFLGMTVGCAKCHDHKYDPITTKNYYQLFAFFNSTKDAPLDGNELNPMPNLYVPSPEETKALDDTKAEMKRLEDGVSLETAEEWLKANYVVPPKMSPWEVSQTFRHKSFDEAFDTDEKPDKWSPIKLVRATAIALASLDNSSNYLRTTLTEDQDRTLAMRFGSDDGIKVWLNGELVHSNKVQRTVQTPTDEVKLNLKKGANLLVVKITNALGGDGVVFDYGNATETAAELAHQKNDPLFTKQTYLRSGPKTEMSKQYLAANDRKMKIDAAIPRTLIAQEMDKPRPAYVLRRGEYNLRGEEVHRGIPEALGKLPDGAPLNRLGLAEWLVDKNNPLTMRVFVNRVWQQHFGTGIVKTAEDFGNQGEWPSHHELLDYLTMKFIEGGYSLKKLHKLILTSAAFRQQSVVTAEKEKIDPENRLISHGPRFRLDAEVLRDQVLQVSGLLVNREGGRGFHPYQPAGLWEEVAFDSSTTAHYTQDTDSGIYRRTLYLFWKRTSPHPMMLNFDAPEREACVVRRQRTNTPLQALTAMNEPAFVESARVFGERIVKTKKTDDERLKFAYQWALGREPSKVESQILLQSAKRYEAMYQANPADAEKLCSSGLAPQAPGLPKSDVAAWTMIANTIFNLDEFLTQH